MTTETAQRTTNDELFVKVLAQIEKTPERWDQAEWFTPTECGTAACFAGWACLLSGYEVYGLHVIDTDGHPTGTGIAAGNLLGIGPKSWPDDGHLFSSENTMDDLYAISARVMGVDVQVLRDKVAAEVQAS